MLFLFFLACTLSHLVICVTASVVSTKQSCMYAVLLLLLSWIFCRLSGRSLYEVSDNLADRLEVGVVCYLCMFMCVVFVCVSLSDLQFMPFVWIQIYYPPILDYLRFNRYHLNFPYASYIIHEGTRKMYLLQSTLEWHRYELVLVCTLNTVR